CTLPSLKRPHGQTERLRGAGARFSRLPGSIGIIDTRFRQSDPWQSQVNSRYRPGLQPLLQQRHNLLLRLQLLAQQIRALSGRSVIEQTRAQIAPDSPGGGSDFVPGGFGKVPRLSNAMTAFACRFYRP